jgi:hypothetical protein
MPNVCEIAQERYNVGISRGETEWEVNIFSPRLVLAVLGSCGCDIEKRQPRLWLPFVFLGVIRQDLEGL